MTKTYAIPQSPW